MRRLFPLALLLSAPSSAASPLSIEDHSDLRCVAALAIAAHEQQRGSPGWAEFEMHAYRAPRFAALVTERISKARKVNAGEVRGWVLTEIKILQESSTTAAAPEAEAQDLTRSCVARLDVLDPPPPDPAMARCAALSTIAYQDLLARDGQTAEATGMAVLASVLENEARKELRARGKSNAESDTALGLEREIIAKTRPQDTALMAQNGAQLQRCMEMVKPPKADGAPH